MWICPAYLTWMHGGESSLLLATPLWPALIFEKKIFSTTLNLILFFRAIGPRCIIYLLTFSNQILKVTWPKIYIKITVILICYGETPLGENRLAWVEQSWESNLGPWWKLVRPQKASSIFVSWQSIFFLCYCFHSPEGHLREYLKLIPPPTTSPYSLPPPTTVEVQK